MACLELGSPAGPLALCLHGFPDTAHTWRHLLPVLAEAGYHAVAPYMRGYAPSGIPADGCYQTGALADDAIAIHRALDADADAVLVGHDWGALAAYGAAGAAPERWRRVVAMSVPPLPASAAGFFTYAQLKRSFYVFLAQMDLADAVVAGDDFAFVRSLWADWSPGYDATADLAEVRRALSGEGRVAAALGYYRAMFDATRHRPDHEVAQRCATGVPPQPTLYLHGADDGCIGAELAGSVPDLLAPGSAAEVVASAGHFLHLQRPDLVNERIADFVAS